MSRAEYVAGNLSPEVGQFVLQVLRQLEQEQILDAPGVINGLVSRMERSECDRIRLAAPWTARLLSQLFAQQYDRRISA